MSIKIIPLLKGIFFNPVSQTPVWETIQAIRATNMQLE